jgi:hypothetical protein
VERTPCDIAHDFSNVVTVICGSAELARRAIEASHPAWPHVERIITATEQVVVLTKELRSKVCDPLDLPPP